MLPSGNIVLVLRQEQGDWVCEYTEMARARGEVNFSGAWLRKYGRQV